MTPIIYNTHNHEGRYPIEGDWCERCTGDLILLTRWGIWKCTSCGKGGEA